MRNRFNYFSESRKKDSLSLSLSLSFCPNTLNLSPLVPALSEKCRNAIVNFFLA